MSTCQQMLFSCFLPKAGYLLFPVVNNGEWKGFGRKFGELIFCKYLQNMQISSPIFQGHHLQYYFEHQRHY